MTKQAPLTAPASATPPFHNVSLGRFAMMHDSRQPLFPVPDLSPELENRLAQQFALALDIQDTPVRMALLDGQLWPVVVMQGETYMLVYITHLKDSGKYYSESTLLLRPDEVYLREHCTVLAAGWKRTARLAPRFLGVSDFAGLAISVSGPYFVPAVVMPERLRAAAERLA